MKMKIDYNKCNYCNSYTCVDCCAMAVFALKKNKPIVVDWDSCTLCGICADLCPKNAIIVQR